MIVVAITHADARKAEEQFRFLTESGVAQVRQAADRLLAKMPAIAPNLKIGKIVSSPAVRCINTCVLLIDAIHNYINTPKIDLDNSLLQASSHTLTIDDIDRVLKLIKEDAVLLCTHSDLFNALPTGYEALRDTENPKFFASRPALVVFEYEHGKPMVVRFCEMLQAGSWKSV